MKKVLCFVLPMLLICAFAAACSNAEQPVGGVEVDLTRLSVTMMYAEVDNIVKNPEDYIGKTIKMSGPYYAVYNAADRYRHFVAVEEADACCMRGLEFEYPEDSLEEKTRIEVTGIYSSYEDGGKAYYYLAVDDVVVLEG